MRSLAKHRELWLILAIAVSNRLAASLLFAVAFLLDGALRTATASLVRFPRWRAGAAWGLVEAGLAILIFSDWPMARERVL